MSDNDIRQATGAVSWLNRNEIKLYR